MVRLLSIFLVLIGTSSAFGQSGWISGKITAAADKSPLPGVSITVKGTSQGVMSKTDGTYAVQAGRNSTLVFSSIGYIGQELSVGDKTVINVELVEDNKTLSEVVVTALGISRESKTLTYTAQQLSSTDLTAVKNTNLANSLNGKIAGVQVNRTSGGPAGSVRIVLRGDKSTRSSQPLFVINGMPILNEIAGGGGPDAGLYNTVPDKGDVLSTLNPDDIESISVLKGPSASALYGSQGSNGVILITTKQGKDGSSKIDFSSSFTTDSPFLLPSLQGSYGQSTPATSSTEGSEDSWGAKLSQPYSNDYVKDFYQTGLTAINSLSFTSGNEVSNNYVSYSNTSNRGVLPNSGLQQNTIMLRQANKFFNKRLSVDGSFMGSIQNSKNRLNPGIYYNPLTGLYLLPRGINFDQYKNYTYFSSSRYLNAQNWWNINTDKGYTGQDYQQNPYWVLYENPVNSKNTNVLGSVTLGYKLNEWLSLQARGNANSIVNDYNRHVAATTQATLASSNGNISTSRSNTLNLYGDILLLGQRSLSDKIGLSFTLGTAIQNQKTTTLNVNGSLVTPNVFLESAIDWTDVSRATLTKDGSRREVQSLFGSVELSWADKIFVNFSDRNDWSSTLAFTPHKNKGFNYYSLGANFILSDLLALPEIISFAKVHASRAIVGNDVAAFATNPLYTFNRGVSSPPGSTPIKVDGYYLQPEKNTSTEIGAEFRFFNNRLSADITWYKSNIENQYFSGISVPPGLGSGGTADVNGGNIRNQGIEIMATYRVLSTNKLSWHSTLNFSRNRNKVIELFNEKIVSNPSPDQRYDLAGGAGSLKQGGAFGDIYGRGFKRDAQGRIVVNGANGVPLAEDNLFLGNPTPLEIVGWNNIINWGNVGINLLIDGKFGGQVFYNTGGYLDQMGVSQKSADARDNGGVTIPNAVTEDGKAYTGKTDAKAYYKGVGGKTPVIEEYLFSATAVRVRELAVSYGIPFKNSKLNNLRLGVMGNNLFFLKKSAPFDPEVVSGVNAGGTGRDVFGFPAYRSWGVSLKASF